LIINAGSVTMFRYNDTVQEWMPLGNTLMGKKPFTSFGNSVDISRNGNIVAVGIAESLQKDQYVSAYRYDAREETWVQLGEDLISDGSFKNYFGTALSLSDDGVVLAIGTPGADGPRGARITDAGMTVIYRFQEEEEDVFQILINGQLSSTAGERRGVSIGISAAMAVVGCALLAL